MREAGRKSSATTDFGAASSRSLKRTRKMHSPTRNAAGHDLRIGGRTDTTYLINSPTGIGGADIAAGSPSPTRGSPPGVSACSGGTHLEKPCVEGYSC